MSRAGVLCCLSNNASCVSQGAVAADEIKSKSIELGAENPVTEAKRNQGEHYAIPRVRLSEYRTFYG